MTVLWLCAPFNDRTLRTGNLDARRLNLTEEKQDGDEPRIRQHVCCLLCGCTLEVLSGQEDPGTSRSCRNASRVFCPARFLSQRELEWAVQFRILVNGVVMKIAVENNLHVSELIDR